MTSSGDHGPGEPYALMFPGQGSQFAGMGADLMRESTAAARVFARGDEVLGYPLSKIMAGEQGDALNRTVHTQPAIFVHSMALFEVIKERVSFRPVVAAGHSLGEYSALCAAGVLPFEEALDIIRVRAEGMDAAQPAGTCCMAAVIGLSKERVIEIVQAQRGAEVLEVANFNSPDQVVISGSTAAVSRTLDALKGERRARGVMLPVSSAFHTSLMEPARAALAQRLERASPCPQQFPVVANVNARQYPGDPGVMREWLTDQVVRPVLWENCIQTMQQLGAVRFVEIGPGKVLTGLLRRIDRQALALNVSDMDGIRLCQGEIA